MIDLKNCEQSQIRRKKTLTSLTIQITKVLMSVILGLLELEYLLETHFHIVDDLYTQWILYRERRKTMLIVNVPDVLSLEVGLIREKCFEIPSFGE